MCTEAVGIYNSDVLVAGVGGSCGGGGGLGLGVVLCGSDGFQWVGGRV